MVLKLHARLSIDYFFLAARNCSSTKIRVPRFGKGLVSTRTLKLLAPLIVRTRHFFKLFAFGFVSFRKCCRIFWMSKGNPMSILGLPFERVACPLIVDYCGNAQADINIRSKHKNVIRFKVGVV